MEVSKVYNNNLVLARRGDGTRVVVMGRGIGYGRRPGDVLDPRSVEQTFVPENAAEETTVVDLLRHVPLEHVQLTESLLRQARERLQVRWTQAIFLGLLDHLSFAIRRAESGERIDFPLHDQVEQLYPDEVALGRASLQEVRERTGLALADEEAGALAMHLVAAQMASGSVSKTVTHTETIGEVLDAVGAAMGRRLDRADLQTSRFITHLRFLLARSDRQRHAPEAPSDKLVDTILTSWPAAAEAAAAAAGVLERRLHVEVRPDERAYLTLHVARLMARN